MNAMLSKMLFRCKYTVIRPIQNSHIQRKLNVMTGTSRKDEKKNHKNNSMNIRDIILIMPSILDMFSYIKLSSTINSPFFDRH